MLIQGIREFAVSPLLVATLPGVQYERRRKEKTETDLDWSEIRTDRLLDSAVSGFFTGGIIRGLTSASKVFRLGSYELTFE